MWTWNSDPFGTDAANPNPAGAGAFAYNIRFAGQLFDGQAGLHQNWNRWYDPATGGYPESDPLGLAGGSFSTYAYVGGNPLSRIDPWGLAPGDPFGSVQEAAVDALNWVYQTYPGVNAEYAGTVYQGANNKYYATQPNKGIADQVAPSYPPGGSRDTLGLYHTHGQCTKGLGTGNDVFSSGIPSDEFAADWRGVPSFLETPGHEILRYDPDPSMHQKGKVTQIQTGCDCPRN